MSDHEEGVPAPVRLLFRTENEFCNCYIAGMENTEDLVRIGSMRLGCVLTDPALFEAYKELMKVALTSVLAALGMEVKHTEEIPRHELPAGHA